MMAERGVAVDHSMIYRWVQHYAPEMEKRLRWQWRRPQSRSWRIDETYVKVRGKWAYLYRAVDKLGNTIDFYFSSTRNTGFVINIGDEIDISDEIEAGWAVARHAGGRGHAMEGTTKALDFAFTNLGTRPSAPSQAR